MSTKKDSTHIAAEEYQKLLEWTQNYLSNSGSADAPPCPMKKDILLCDKPYDNKNEHPCIECLKNYFNSKATKPNAENILREIYDTINGTNIMMGYNSVCKKRQTKVEKAEIEITNHWLNYIKKTCEKAGLDVTKQSKTII